VTTPFKRQISRRLPDRVKIRRRRAALADGAPFAHYLHVPKTAGTALQHAIDADRPSNYTVMFHPHSVRLSDLPGDDAFFLTVRDPIERFVSAFNSRLREGRPRYVTPWTASERAVFTRYSTPNELGLALASSDSHLRRDAERAVRSVPLLQSSYWDWFRNERMLRRNIHRVLWVGWVPTLHADFGRLRRVLGLTASVQLPTDAVTAHRAPRITTSPLDARVESALRKRCSAEYEFLELLAELASVSYTSSAPSWTAPTP
jgi:hypothetical protein